ncbi:MAG: hypothetical protein ACRD2I_13500 [Vicinamibacterales bacterium]
MMPAKFLVLCALAGGLFACGGPTSTSPTVAPVPAAGAASQALTLAGSGYVLDTALRRVTGAKVEVLDGPQAGAVMIADADGQFPLVGAFVRNNTFRASKEGFVTTTQRFSQSSAGGAPYLIFYLNALDQPASIGGEYSLTFIPDSACVDLPSEVRARSYDAIVVPASEQTGPSTTSFRLTVRNTSVLGNLNGLGIGVAGNSLGFWMDGGHDPTLVEQLDASRYVAYSGLGWAAVETPVGATISATFEGWVDYCVMKTPMGGGYNCGTSNVTGEPIPGAAVTYAHCQSANHRLILQRR